MAPRRRQPLAEWPFIENVVGSSGWQKSNRPRITNARSRAPGQAGRRRYDRNRLEGFGIKPELQCPTLQGTLNVKRWLIDTGTLRSAPYFVNMHLGTSDAIPTNLGEPLTTQLLLNSLETIPDGCTKGLFPCGRNWLPTAAAGLTQGLDFIRVGGDDAVWLYPHKDELAPSSAEMVRRVVAIAHMMGIDIATPAEARVILGIPERSAKRASSAA